MPDTPYATVAEVKPRCGVGQADTPTNMTSDDLFQLLLDSASHLVDQNTRIPPVGQYAFTATEAGVTRYYDDDMSGVIAIDDVLEITAVQRNGVDVDYAVDPPNELPVTALVLVEGGSGHRAITVTGTWGYCTEAARPAAVREATLQQATAMYRSLDADPLDDLTPMVLLLISSLMRPAARQAVEQRRKDRLRLAAMVKGSK
jgi:hypothetical protein